MTVDRAESRIVSLQGPATIYEVGALRETLVDASAAAEDLQIDLGESGKWGLAGLQLLISCVNTGRRLGRKVQFVRVPSVCREIAKRSGLSAWLDEATV